MQVKIKHDIRGRMRIHISTLRNNHTLAKIIEQRLNNANLTHEITLRLRSGNVIIYYQHNSQHRQQILDLLRQLESPPPIANTTHDGCHCMMHCATCHPEKKDPPSLLRQSLGISLLTGYVVWVFVRQVILKKEVSESPLSLTSAVALVGALPLLKHAWHDLKSGKHKSLFPFLAATCILAIGLGQALTALEVIWILRIGMLLEDYVAQRSHRAIRDILELSAKDAFVLIDGVEVEIPVEQIETGSTVVCHTGEKIPVDGVIIKGEALVDESPVNGRAEVATLRADDNVFAGTIIRQGVLFIRADKVGDDTYLCRILNLVENSLSNRAPAETRADELANRLMKLGAIAVAGTFAITLSPVRAFTVLLVLACPCATVLAASTAVSAALANAARNHILIKGGYYLEQIGQADCFCFDKTGTLTVETPEVIEIFTRTARQKPESVLLLAAGAEAHTPHPMARAIINEAQQRGLTIPTHAHCEFVIGRGVTAVIDNDTVLVGNDKWMADNHINISHFNRHSSEQLECGYTLIYVAKNGKAQGLISVANPLRPKTAAVLKWLRDNGVHEMHLVTGDTQRMAQAIGEQFDFHHWEAELLPEEKSNYLKKLEMENRKVVMVGDGVNDALALANAQVGIAMGAGGAEVAIEAADVALADSDLEKLVKLRQLSTKTLNTIEQNHQLAMWTNLGGAVLGASGFMTPLMAGGLHIIHTLGIVLNSSRLLNWNAKGLPSHSTQDQPKHDQIG